MLDPSVWHRACSGSNRRDNSVSCFWAWRQDLRSPPPAGANTDAGPFHAIRWTLSGGRRETSAPCSAPPLANSIAFGISGDAATIVGWSNATPGSPLPFRPARLSLDADRRRTGSRFAAGAASSTSIAWATNSDGSVIVGQTDGFQPARLSLDAGQKRHAETWAVWAPARSLTRSAPMVRSWSRMRRWPETARMHFVGRRRPACTGFQAASRA